MSPTTVTAPAKRATMKCWKLSSSFFPRKTLCPKSKPTGDWSWSSSTSPLGAAGTSTTGIRNTSTLKITQKLRTGLPLSAALAWLVFESALAQPITPIATNAPAQTVTSSLAGDTIVLPTGFNDPIEPFNRAIWAFNRGFMTSVVRPASKAYRRVVVKPVRTGIGNMGKNLTFPDRLVNNMLQGNWAGMGEETERCLCNTVIGLGGFFDVATHWGVPKHDADFGQTFRKWGWKPGIYLMLPVFGPSDGRDATGLV